MNRDKRTAAGRRRYVRQVGDHALLLPACDGHLNFRAVDRAFDTERYVLDTHPDAQRSGGNLVV
ncbi:MAG TPA: hypothetical protein VIU64_10120, partial [Polyangia bacterium]